MAKFESRYRSLSFYVDGERYEFRDGLFETDDPKVKIVLNMTPDAQRIGAEAAEKEVAQPQKTKAASRRKATTPTKE